MPNTIKDYYQAEIDRAIQQIQAWTPDPVVNANNEVVVTATDKINALTTLRQRAQTASDALNQISYNESAAAAQQANISAGVYPAIGGVKTFFDGGGGLTMTTEWSIFTNAFYRRFLALTAGLQDPLSTPAAYSAFAQNTTAFEVPPYFISNCDRFRENINIANKQKSVSSNSTNEFNYPSRPFAILALKNTNSTTDKTVTLDLSGSSNSNNGNYTSFQVSVFTPDNTNSNRSLITEAGTFATNAAVAGNPGWRNIINNTTNAAQATITPSIVIPADKTVLIMILACDYYWIGTAPMYVFSRHLQLRNLATTAYADPQIVADVGVLKNIMNKNLNNLGQLFTVVPA